MNTKDALWMMSVAEAISARATCQRAAVGCVLFDFKKRILSTGYNGPPQKHDHCNKHCPGMAFDGGDNCMSVHAEVNALIQCRSPDEVVFVVCTHLPCFRCAKALLNTAMEVLYYKHTHVEDDKVLELLYTSKKLFIRKI